MLTIGELAAYAGVTVRAVRHYHAKGLLPEPERDHSGYRRDDAPGARELLRYRPLPRPGVPLARGGGPAPRADADPDGPEEHPARHPGRPVDLPRPRRDGRLGARRPAGAGA